MLEKPILDALVNTTLGIQDDRRFLSSILDPVVIPERDFSFILFTKVNPDEPFLMKLDDSENLQESSFNALHLTKIIIHGWTDSSQASWLQEMRRNYLNVGAYNVICINWFAGSVKEYLAAAKITRQVSIVPTSYSSEGNDFLVQ